MARIIWSREAAAKVETIRRYIKRFDPKASERMAKRLVAAGGSLADFPNRGRPARDGTREMVTVPPYVLRYETRDDLVTILGVRHGARLGD